MTKENSRRRSATLTLATLLASVTFALLFQACLSRQQVRAYTWLNNGLPADLCAKQPELLNYGFYRKLNNGTFEFVSFCDPKAQHWIAIYDQDFEKILDALLPKKRGQNE